MSLSARIWFLYFQVHCHEGVQVDAEWDQRSCWAAWGSNFWLINNGDDGNSDDDVEQTMMRLITRLTLWRNRGGVSPSQFAIFHPPRRRLPRLQPKQKGSQGWPSLGHHLLWWPIAKTVDVDTFLWSWEVMEFTHYKISSGWGHFSQQFFLFPFLLLG